MTQSVTGFSQVDDHTDNRQIFRPALTAVE